MRASVGSTAWMRAAAMRARLSLPSRWAMPTRSLYSAHALAFLPSFSWQTARFSSVPDAGSSRWLSASLGHASAYRFLLISSRASSNKACAAGAFSSGSARWAARAEHGSPTAIESHAARVREPRRRALGSAAARQLVILDQVVEAEV